MPNYDSNVVINVTGDVPVVPSASFNVILLIAAATTLGIGFTERYREYTSTADVAADAASGDISAATAAKLNAWLTQVPRAGKVMVGRADIEAQVTTITISTTADGTWEIDLVTPSGVEINATYAASGSAAASAVATGLRAALTSALGSGSGITVGGTGADITLTAAAGDDAFTGVTIAEPGIGVGDIVATNAAVPLKTELDAILAETTGFYMVAQETTTSHILHLRLSQWIDVNSRFGIHQTADSVTITSGTTDIAYALKTALNARNAVVYHNTAGNAEHPAFLVPAKKLSANPDRTSVAWAYTQISGLTAQKLSATAKGHLTSKNCNVYGVFKGLGSFQPGKMANGDWFDKRITFDWVEARARESVQSMLIAVANRNEGKLGVDDDGIQAVASCISAVLKQGEAAGHFVRDTTKVIAPVAADLTLAEKQSGAITLTALGELRVGIYTVTANMTLVVDLASLGLA